MADHERREAGSVADLLFDDPSRFSFLQAVRLLEDIGRSSVRRPVPPGETAHEENELVFFSHNVRFDNPPSDIETIVRGDRKTPALMSVNIMGLAGLFGPLPHTVTEAVLDQSRQRNPAFARFLDIFNHRLVSLLYRARKKYRPVLDSRGPHDGRVARALYAIVGLGTPNLRGRVLDPPPKPRSQLVPVERADLNQRDRALLAYSGLLAGRYRSPVGLKRTIEAHFGVDAQVVPFIGAWEAIAEDDLTVLGEKNNILGRTAFIGKRFWNQAARFEVRIGPLDLRRFRSFLPEANDAYVPLRSLIRFYAHEHLGFDIRLILASGQMPQLTLSRACGVHLGHDSWLSRRPRNYEDHQVRLAGQR